MPDRREGLPELLVELRALLPKIKAASTNERLREVGQELDRIIERRGALSR